MVAFSIGSFNVYWYGLFYLASFVIGYFFLWYVGKLAKNGSITVLQGYPKIIQMLTENLDDLMLALIIGVLVGGRIGHVLLYGGTYYLQNPSEIIAVWHGGMSFVGGIIGVCVGLLTIKKIYSLGWKDFFILTDIILLIVPVGIILGRLGNFLNQELYGIVVSSTRGGNTLELLKNLGVIHIYPKVDTLWRWNTNFLSIILEGVVVCIIVRGGVWKNYKKNMWKAGKITVLFLLFYSIFRFILEYLRQDSQAEFIGWFSITQRCMIAIWIGIFFLVMKKKRIL